MSGDVPRVMFWLNDEANHSNRTTYGNGIQCLALTLCLHAICAEILTILHVTIFFRAEGCRSRGTISNAILC